ncbi:putative leucine-rich repeat receptor-like protein kinase At2g19210 [Cryptomeria japonica]|uniref:putative leucine-rich repeat receptor-like protein kinase At2g19210 n=1 Tax=Cryptomeria japonica TaxID=3369 RepID=UPI0025AD4A5A|nr:putative leucine-rich repeat receptor-like protein kinase At2g19210 [Cryptomeria japonica]
MRKALILFIVSAIFASPACSQPGFLSLDCGGTENYTDDAGIQWIPDDAYINSGQKVSLSNVTVGGEASRQMNGLRRFPERRKSCYQLTPLEIGTKYLLRGIFVYGNYDNLNSPPQFDLLLDADVWDGLSFSDSTTYVVQKKIIFMAKFDPTNVCLARINESLGIPVISSLELRPLNQSMYWPVNQDYSLLRLENSNLGARITDNDVRYPDDPFDRTWSAYPEGFPNITSKMKVSIGVAYDQPPSRIMQIAETSYPNSPSVMELPFRRSKRYGNLYISMYFAELKADLNATNLREFDLFLDNNKLNGDPIQPMYLQSSNISVVIPYGITNYMAFRLQATNRSTLPPIANALEIYRQSSQHQQGTSIKDVEAINNIQQQINYTYVGDPCLPVSYSWDWLLCNHDPSPKIVNLNLSKKRLNGNIPTSISNLIALEIIDLSNNNLSGTIPESLSSLKNLKNLNLENNNLVGPVPVALLNNKNLNLSLSGNVHLCQKDENGCSSTTTNKGLIIGLATGGGIALVILSAVALLIIRRKKKRNQAPVPTNLIEPSSRKYSYKEVKEMTEKFSRQIGKGGFGPVFYGCLKNGQEVAVKVCSETSKQGSREFTTEVALLSRVHHKNLVALLGYCCEGEYRILIYEFMSKGNLNELLHGSSAAKQCLDWETRLDIALNAAQGLEYLHAGCKPQIIHRDIKSSNILLSERMEAKVADFGLSREGPASEATHVSTDVKGTFGYLDPQFNVSNNLTEKCDVYSFGVVILEILSGRIPIDTNFSEEQCHIVSWARSLISEGRIESLIDAEARENIELGVMWKVAELALLCTESQANKRPSMSEVVTELKEAVGLLHTIDNSDSILMKDASFAIHFSSATDGNSLPSAR